MRLSPVSCDAVLVVCNTPDNVSAVTASPSVTEAKSCLATTSGSAATTGALGGSSSRANQVLSESGDNVRCRRRRQLRLSGARAREPAPSEKGGPQAVSSSRVITNAITQKPCASDSSEEKLDQYAHSRPFGFQCTQRLRASSRAQLSKHPPARNRWCAAGPAAASVQLSGDSR